MTETTLALRGDDFKMGLEPATITAAMDLAVSVTKSGLFGIKSPEDALVRLMTGRSLGIPAMVSLQKIFVIDGKPGLPADLIQALTQAHPMVEYFRLKATSDTAATYVAKRRGDPEVEYTFTIEDARAALLLDRGETDDKKAKSNWNRWRPQMLRARAITNLAKIVCPEAGMGLPSIEELQDERTITIDPTTGEILENGATSSARTPPAPPAKDWKHEAEALRAKVEAAATPQDFKDARKAIDEAKDIPSMLIDPIIETYNRRRAEAKKAAEAAKPATA